MPSVTTLSAGWSRSSLSAWVCSLEKRDSLVPLVGDVFALPFMLFSMAGGFFADRFSKRNVAIAVKCAELGIMSVVTLGLWLVNIPLMLAGIFLMSTHSAIFGPTKYGMLPELLPEKKLSWGNGIFGLGTFSAAIAGTILAGSLSDTFGKRQIWSGVILIALALVGLSLCLGVRACPPPIRHKNSARISSAISGRNSRPSAATAFCFLASLATRFFPFSRCCCN